MSSSYRSKDKGWAWVVVASSFFSRLLHEGILKSLGVLLPTLSDNFDVPVWVIGDTISLMAVIGGILGILSSKLAKSLHPRWIVMASGVLIGSGLILSCFSNSWTLISIYLILMTGVGMRYAVLILMSVLGYYFEKHYAIANSIAISGTSIGVMIFAPLTQFFLDIYGWRGALLLLGALSVNLSTCGALLKHNTGKYDSYRSFGKSEEEEGECWNSFAALLWHMSQKLTGDIECNLFRDNLFLVWVSTNCMLEYTWAGWLIYLVPYARDKGLSPYQSTSLATSAGIGFMLGLFPTGYLVDVKMPHFGSKEIRAVTLLFGGIALVIDPLLNSMVVLVLTSILFGTTIGSLKVTSYSTAKEIKGDLMQILSWMFLFVSLAKITSGFLTGWLYEYTSSYDVSFVVLGTVMLFASLLQMLYVISTWGKESITTFEDDETSTLLE